MKNSPWLVDVKSDFALSVDRLMRRSELAILPGFLAQDMAIRFQHIQSEIKDIASSLPSQLTDIEDSLESKHVAFSAVCIELVKGQICSYLYCRTVT